MTDEELKLKISTHRNEIKQWAKINLSGKTVKHPSIGTLISFGMNGIKEALNQPHAFTIEKNEALKNIELLIVNGIYKGYAPDINNKVKNYHYIEITIAGSNSYVVVKENQSGEFHFYSIVDKIKG